MAQNINNLNDDYDEDLLTESEIAALNDMNHSEQFFLEGLYSDELPSDIFKKRLDKFFPNHF